MKAFFILLAGALLCYLVAAVYPGTSIATVFSVASAGVVDSTTNSYHSGQ